MAYDVRVDVSGIDRMLRSEPGKVEQWLDGVAENIVTDIKLSFGTSPAGLSYIRGGVTHIASQPGFPPNIDIGTLWNSIRWEKTGRRERTVLDGVEYGIYLEDGTEDMLPRPFMVPAFERARREIERDAQSNLGLEK